MEDIINDVTGLGDLKNGVYAMVILNFAAVIGVIIILVQQGIILKKLKKIKKQKIEL